MLCLTLAVAAAISPLTVSVETSDGAVVAVAIADADAEVKEVCAADVVDGVSGAETCAAVVVERGGLVAHLDRASSSQMQITVKSSRSAWRGTTNAVVATGLGGASVALAVSAWVMGAGASSVAGGRDINLIDAALTENAVAGSRASTAAVLSAGSGLLWIGAAASAVSAITLGVIAAGEHDVVE